MKILHFNYSHKLPLNSMKNLSLNRMQNLACRSKPPNVFSPRFDYFIQNFQVREITVASPMIISSYVSAWKMDIHRMNFQLLSIFVDRFISIFIIVCETSVLLIHGTSIVEKCTVFISLSLLREGERENELSLMRQCDCLCRPMRCLQPLQHLAPDNRSTLSLMQEVRLVHLPSFIEIGWIN